MERGAACREQLAAAGEVESVVRLASVEGAAPSLHDPLRLQPPEVVGNERLRSLEQAGQLVHTPVAVRELDEQPPAERMGGQPQKAGRALALRCRRTSHTGDIHQTRLMYLDAASRGLTGETLERP